MRWGRVLCLLVVDRMRRAAGNDYDVDYDLDYDLGYGWPTEQFD